MEMFLVVGLVVLGVNVLLTILNGVMAVRNNDLLTAIRDSMNRNAVPMPE